MFHLRQNVPLWERLLRVGLGLLLVAAAVAGLTSPGRMTTLAYVAAAGLALTGFVGFCPACAMVGRRLDSSSAKSRSA